MSQAQCLYDAEKKMKEIFLGKIPISSLYPWLVACKKFILPGQAEGSRDEPHRPCERETVPECACAC